MEPVTQALLGAATAELVAGPRLRGRALGWGAVIGMSPDLDVLLGPLHDGYGEWLYHRGTTHSLWFGPVVGPLIGWLLWRWRDLGQTETLPGWIRLAVVALFTHPLLDGFTPYGTQLFAPFARDRFAWNGVAIVDPLYSLMLAAGVFVAARAATGERRRRAALVLALAASTAYLAIGTFIGQRIERDLRDRFARTGAPVERVRAYPTIFQPWLRSFVVRGADTTWVGLHSWQAWSCPAWRAWPRLDGDPAVAAVAATWEGQLLTWFADGDTVATLHHEPGGVRRVRIDDVRYAWASAEGRGMWGLEARIGADGALLGPPRRRARSGPAADDWTRLTRLLAGRLPDANGIWSRPADCDRATAAGPTPTTLGTHADASSPPVFGRISAGARP